MNKLYALVFIACCSIGSAYSMRKRVDVKGIMLNTDEAIAAFKKDVDGVRYGSYNEDAIRELKEKIEELRQGIKDDLQQGRYSDYFRKMIDQSGSCGLLIDDLNSLLGESGDDVSN